MSESDEFNTDLCKICKKTYHVDLMHVCSNCESYVCNDCIDEAYYIEWNEILCDSCSSYYYTQKKRHCYRCKEAELNFFHAKRIALELMTEKNVIKIWNSNRNTNGTKS